MSERLDQLSEAEILAAFLPRLPVGTHTQIGPGDDAAVVRIPGEQLVITTDSLIEGTEFHRAWSSPFDIGWKAAAINLADVAAMGGEPVALVVAVAAPSDFLLDDLCGIADGLAAAVAELAPGTGVVGGDLARAPQLSLSVTATGLLHSLPVSRSGARAGDTVAIAGQLGQAAAGFELLQLHAIDDTGLPDAAAAAAIRDRPVVQAQLRPRPPVHLGPAAAAAGAHAMIDVSDGLVKDALRIARASGVVLDLDAGYFAALPATALWGGEDHALLACFGADSALPEGFVAIGSVRAGGPGVQLGGQPLVEHGWETFRGQL